VVAEERAAGNKEAKVDPFRLHDIRRYCATGWAALGIDRETVRGLLNHSDGSVTARYEIYARAAEKRAALDRWAKHLAGIVAGQPAAENVVTLKRVEG
jgi:integrase